MAKLKILIKYSGIFFVHFFQSVRSPPPGPGPGASAGRPGPPWLLGTLGTHGPVTWYHGRPGPPGYLVPWAPWAPPRLLGTMGALAPPVTWYHGRPGPPPGYLVPWAPWPPGYLVPWAPWPPGYLVPWAPWPPRLLGTMGALAPPGYWVPWAPWPPRLCLPSSTSQKGCTRIHVYAWHIERVSLGRGMGAPPGNITMS